MAKKNKKTTKIQGYHYDNEKQKFRVRLTYQGFRYNGGSYESEVEAILAVKKLNQQINEGKAIPSSVSPTVSKLNQMREEMLGQIKKSNGILTVKTQDELIDSVVKDSPQYKKTQERLAKAKTFSFEPDTEPEVERTDFTTIEPKKEKPMKPVAGLDILDRLNSGKKQSVVEEKQVTLTTNELESIIASAVKKALSEALSGIQGNKRTGR